MFRNILVISDNTRLRQGFKDLIQNKGLDLRSWEFGISHNYTETKNNEEIFEGVTTYDLKNTEQIREILERFDLVFSMHCKQIFPLELIKRVRCINIHPGYNPSTRGWYPQVFAILRNLQIGATIHEIDGRLDHGAIICRESIEINSWDTSGSLYEKIIEKEFDMLNRCLGDILNDNYKTFLPESNGNVFYKSDFEKLLEIDLNEKKTGSEWINLFRALTHNDYHNAFYIDPKTNKKIFIKIDLIPDE